MNAVAPELVPIDGAVWSEMLDALTKAIGGGRKRRLLRLAEREHLEVDDAARELAAFPAAACVALHESIGLSPSRCLAGRGCRVEDECSLVSLGHRSVAGSALAGLVRALVRRRRRSLPAAPLPTLSHWARPIRELLERSGTFGADAPPPACVPLALIDRALQRGGPLAATGAFLTKAEMEQLAAFVPPGSGRGDDALSPIEGWLRRAVLEEVALVEMVEPDEPVGPASPSRRR
ncbi:MAG: hypothetical protein JSV80_12685 [Acidobacteriota bacterium]|nr:MAG: hypothetical protein JSV80_12685 [Acidobacteriota bacterium]